VSLTSDTIRYGIIGAGMMGREHIRNLLELDDVRVTALADPHQRSVDNALADLRGEYVFSGGSGKKGEGDAPKAQPGPPPAVFSSPKELLTSGLCDAVVIATPNYTHAAVLDEVFTNHPDTHVLVEKPLATTIDDAKRITDRASQHRGIVWVGLEYRFMPPVARFLAEVPAALGRLHMMSIREHRFPFLPKVGDWNRFSVNTGGTLVEKCCHFFDLMNLTVAQQTPGARPVRVMASGGQSVNHLDERYPNNPAGKTPDILDNAYVVVEYSNGVRTMLDLCMFAEASVNEQELCAVGNAGKVEAFVPTGMVRVGKRAPLRNGFPQQGEIVEFDASRDPRVRHGGFHHGSSYLEHLAFAEAVRNGGAPGVAVEDGLWSVAVGLAAHRSIDQSRPVELAEFL
jgi:myo-inositol 2-dehydrogenase / D-chiro-inositol 1-dehydrogenase